MSLKYYTDFTVAISRSLHFYSHKEFYSLLGISEKVHIIVLLYIILYYIKVPDN